MMVSHLGGAARKTFIILAGFDWCLLKIQRHCCRSHCSHKYKTFCFFFKIILLYDFYLNYIVYTVFGIMDTSIITHTFMLSCTSNVIIQKNWCWRFFWRFKICSNSITFMKPPYLCRDCGFWSCCSIFPFFCIKSKRYDRQVLDFIYLEAESWSTSITSSYYSNG